MFSHIYPAHPDRRLTAFCAVLALHAALIYGWRVARAPVAHEPGEQWPSMQLFWVKPPVVVPPQPTSAPPPRHRLRPAPMPPDRPARAASPSTAAPQPDAPAPATPAGPHAEDLLLQAKAAVGRIAQDLRAEKRGLVTARPDSPALRMRRGIERAAELAPNKWYQEPKMEELVVAGGSGARRYRVITANGEYCVTYETNHALDGRDTMKDGIKPKFTSCPKYEQPATKQE